MSVNLKGGLAGVERKILSGLAFLFFAGGLLLVAAGGRDAFWGREADPVAGRELAALVSFLFLGGIYLCLEMAVLGGLGGWKRAVSTILSVIFILGGMEASLRAFSVSHPRIYRHSPSLLWELSPNLKNVREGDGRFRLSTNGHGLRGEDFSVMKEPGELRVMVIGDSAAFGWPLNDGESFACYLEKELAAGHAGLRPRVINAAVPGYSSLQGLVFMGERGWGFAPDVLVVAFNNDCFHEAMEDKDRLASPALRPLLRALYRCHLYVLLLDSLGKGRINPEDAGVTPPDKGKARVAAWEVEAVLDTLAAEAMKRKASVVIVSLPARGRVREYPGFSSYRDIMRKKAAQHGLPFLDMFGDGGDAWEGLMVDGLHPSTPGHREIARRLLPLIPVDGGR